MPDDQSETFGEVIQELQGDHSQRQFAKLAADVSPASVNEWLQSRVPKLKLLLQVAEALEEAELLEPAQRERLFRTAGYVDPRRDRASATATRHSVTLPPPTAAPAPDLKAYFSNRPGSEPGLDRLLRLYGELIRECQKAGQVVPALDAASLGPWEALSEVEVDAYISRLRRQAAGDRSA